MPSEVGLRRMLAEGGSALGVPLDAGQIDRLWRLFRFLVTPPLPIRLSAIRDEREILTAHILDSLSLVRFMEGGRPDALLDVGAGNGLPGLALKLLWPEMALTSIEAHGKAVRYLAAMAEALEVRDGWVVVQGRAEELAHLPRYRERFPVATTRALASARIAVELVLPFVKPGGCFLALKGPKGDEELADASEAIAVLGGEVSGVDRIVLPGTEIRRRIVRIRKIRETPDKFPRRFSAIRRGAPNVSRET